ncbi:hypothetical protein MNBD_GAMMA05-1624 [hydrothermal vent metagenome]|uniref:DUF4412 domain-containing protein n=1 Tax=hydrothermal vent metagenome TaxID=652676 RepID=A0A3B0WNK9_9ZZZZ
MINTIRLMSAILLLNSSVVVAGTIVTMKSDNEFSKIMTDGKKARMGMGDDGYIIVDYKTNSVKAVDPKRKQVMLLNTNNLPKGGNALKVNVSINDLGSGPTIAGYKTRKFSYKVNGKSCGIIYGSKAAYKVKGIKELFDAMQMMVKRQQAIMGGYVGMIDACTLGDTKIGEHVAKVGVPMRMVENGKVDTEIVKIKLNVSLPANTFVVPSSYKTKTMAGEINKAKKNMAEMGQQMGQKMQPQLQQMIQQMQQSGQMPPEVMEQLRKTQEQMRQYQQ